jgi:hypothetical protein
MWRDNPRTGELKKAPAVNGVVKLNVVAPTSGIGRT